MKRRMLFPACAECGMTLAHPNEYHPYAACLMYKSCKDRDTVLDNLQSVIDYGYDTGFKHGKQSSDKILTGDL